jgi:hypothetical protein
MLALLCCIILDDRVWIVLITAARYDKCMCDSVPPLQTTSTASSMILADCQASTTGATPRRGNGQRLRERKNEAREMLHGDMIHLRRCMARLAASW